MSRKRPEISVSSKRSERPWRRYFLTKSFPLASTPSCAKGLIAAQQKQKGAAVVDYSSAAVAATSTIDVGAAAAAAAEAQETQGQPHAFTPRLWCV